MPTLKGPTKRKSTYKSEVPCRKRRLPFGQKHIVGRIYRIFHPDILRRNKQGLIIEASYIGRTEDEVRSRFSKHLVTARKYRGRNVGGDGKLHAVMWAHDCRGFEVEELFVARSMEELAEMELLFQQEFDSIDCGWNKIAAARISKTKSARLRFKLNGVAYRFPSYASICQHFGISNTSLNWWRLKRGFPLARAIKKTIEGREKADVAKHAGVTVFRRRYESTNDAARNKRLNKHKFPASTIRARVKRGMSLEDAFTIPRKVARKEILSVRAPDGKRYQFPTLTEGHGQLKKKFSVPPYSTVSSYYYQQGMSLEQAFGFQARPWEKRYDEFRHLLKRGYSLIGEKSPFAIPVVLHATKEIFASVRVFARQFGIEYTTAASEIKAGLSPESILKKRQHPAV